MPEKTEQLTNLPIGHADQPFIHQLVCFGISGLPLHDVTLCLLIRQGDSGDLRVAGLLLEEFQLSTVLSLPCPVYSVPETALPNKRDIPKRPYPLPFPQFVLTGSWKILRLKSHEMNVKKRSIRWLLTLNQNTRGNYLSIFLPPVLSLGCLRTCTFFLETKKPHSPCQCPSQYRGWWLFPEEGVCLQWWRSGTAWFQECYWSRCRQ